MKNLKCYSNSLNLKLALKSQNFFNYLDINIKMKKGDLITNIHDKQNSFNFGVLKMLCFGSNVHLSIYRNISVYGLNRIDRLSSVQRKKNGVLCIWFNHALNYGYPAELLNGFLYNFVKYKNYRTDIEDWLRQRDE